MFQRLFWVYILASPNRAIYVGVTNDLQRRVHQHKRKELPGFTAKYNVDRLVYYAEFQDPREAIAYEKKLKGLMRRKKVELIQKDNSYWEDLAADWFDNAPN